MKIILRWGGIAMIAAGAVLAAVFFFSGPPAPEGELTQRMDVKENVIGGAYKLVEAQLWERVYGRAMLTYGWHVECI